jgi:hypothetical protein
MGGPKEPPDAFLISATYEVIGKLYASEEINFLYQSFHSILTVLVLLTIVEYSPLLQILNIL